MSVDHDPHRDEAESGPDRRSLMKAAAAVAVPLGAAGIVAACSSSNSTQQSPNNSGSSGGGNTPVEVPVADVPVGGGTVVESAKVVVTQPTAGVFKAFNATCTHAGCSVKTITDNQIHCPCHGSIFSATDGSVVNGPASRPLDALTAKLNGANIDVTGAAS
jgi:Rieske Fe-S protein